MVVDTIKPETITILEDAKIDYILVEEINFGHCELSRPFDFERYRTTFNKFHIYNLIEYDKILFLDCDVIIRYNIDYLFRYDTPNFCLSEDEDNFIVGIYFLIEPNKNLFEFFKQIRRHFSTDEFVLNFYSGI